MFYPHYLFKINSDLVQDPITKEWVENDNSLQFITNCREQVNGAGKLINSADGQTIAFNSLLHLPLSTQDINVGDEVIIFSDEAKLHLRIQSKVLRFSRDLMHCRVWV